MALVHAHRRRSEYRMAERFAARLEFALRVEAYHFTGNRSLELQTCAPGYRRV